jgi:hypothetical protein
MLFYDCVGTGPVYTPYRISLHYRMWVSSRELRVVMYRLYNQSMHRQCLNVTGLNITRRNNSDWRLVWTAQLRLSGQFRSSCIPVFECNRTVRPLHKHAVSGQSLNPQPMSAPHFSTRLQKHSLQKPSHPMKLFFEILQFSDCHVRAAIATLGTDQ